MASINGEDANEITCRIQLSGILFKRPIGHESAKWSRRFFVVKDSFMMYYADTAQKVLEKTQSLNLHPKGILPLGGCKVDAVNNEPGHPNCIQITASENNSVKVFLAAESEFDRERWVKAIEQASRITWRNAQLGDAMIQQLERRGLEITREKHEYLGKLKEKTAELENEALKAQELQVSNEELKREKSSVEQLATELQQEHENVKRELETKMAEVEKLEKLQEQLQQTSSSLQKSLEELAVEKQRIVAELEKQQTETNELSRDRQKLSEITETLNNKLDTIEQTMTRLTVDKTNAEQSLKHHQVESNKLLTEKHEIKQLADELQQSLNDLSHQKQLTDSELREEIAARLAAERRLREAEESLARIEAKLNEQTQQTQSAEVTSLIADVKTLKRYFENIAFDVKLDANKTQMIKRSIQARKEKRRQAMTVLLDQSQIKPQFQEFLRRRKVSTETSAVSSRVNDVTAADYLPMSPGPRSEEQFMASARQALNSPGVRHTCFNVLNQLSEQQETTHK